MYATKRTIADTPFAEALNELRATSQAYSRSPTAPTRRSPRSRLYHLLVPLLPQRYALLG
jgi:hypothetical protein